MSSLTAELGDFVADMATASVPDDAVAIILAGMTDWVGVMIAGRQEPVVQIVAPVVEDGRSEAWMCAGSGRASAPVAALVNATAAHALDYDDVALGAHPSAVLVAAILAEGEALGSSGEQLIRAYLAGYEVWAELTERDEDRHHEKGWHPTAVFGPLAAAAACAVLRSQDPLAASRAIAIAASFSGGIVANFGTMTKPLHAGRAAHSGVLAARLADAGLTAAADAIEHDTGFLTAISPAGRVRRDGAASLGRRWHILEQGLNIKRYPLCYATHRSVDGALGLMQRHDVDPDEIERIEVVMSVTQAKILRNSRPQTGLDAKFSIQFAMATAAVNRAAGLAELKDDRVRHPQVQSLMDKVVVDTEVEGDPADPIFSRYERVKVQLRDGQVLDSGEIRHARGHARLPMSAGELRTKFADCLDYGGAAAGADRLFATLQDLARLSVVPADLFDSLPPAGHTRAAPVASTA